MWSRNAAVDFVVLSFHLPTFYEINLGYNKIPVDRSISTNLHSKLVIVTKM